jgi:hypothetical protein
MRNSLCISLLRGNYLGFEEMNYNFFIIRLSI